MERAYFEGNRRRFWEQVEGDGVLVLFSGRSYRRSADENYPFYAHRDFVYFTGLTKENLIYLAAIETPLTTNLTALNLAILKHAENGALINTQVFR